jgi:short-subunit dehydrogenase
MHSEIAPGAGMRDAQASHPAIVITGAASGIGREIARLAAMEGSALVLVDCADRMLDDIVAELAAFGVTAAAVRFDPTCGNAVALIEHALRERKLHCDVLVNCADLQVPRPVSSHSDPEAMSQIELNVRVLTELTLHFLPGMVARARGGVLNLGSVTGKAPAPAMAIYYASKAFVNSFSVALASELAGTGVTVTCLAAGIVMTRSFAQRAAAQARLRSLIPQSDAFDAAAAGWLGFKAGKRVVVPGMRNQVVVTLMKLLPRSMVLRLIGLFQRSAIPGV